ncbi:MAG: DUF262 domain-containing protein [Chloroflexi bacterium]|nr:DUF262 domain-containing protein [Chloroflexota bacterium]
MKSEDAKLQKLLEGTKQYVIPLFQRVYTWKKDEWDELWRDILDIYDQDCTREHFMGAIVTMPVRMQPHGVNKFLLIDGQQRLTTFFVLLACIRDLSTENDEKLSQKIDNLYLKNQFEENGNHYKLLPTHLDREPFLEVVESKPKTDSPIAQVYEHFLERLQGNDLLDKPIDLNVLLDSMIEQLIFVTIRLEPDDSPYRIFHSLNGTGQDLTEADLVRNFIFMHTPPERQTLTYERYWRPIQEKLKGRELTDYMWRFVTKDGKPVAQKGVYDEIRNRISRVEDPNSTVNAMLIDMHKYSAYNSKLIDPSLETEPRLRTRLLHLQRWELTTPFPLLLNLFNDLSEKKLSVDQVCGVMDAVESYVVRRFFCSIPIRAMTNHFIRMYSNIKESADIIAAAYQYLKTKDFPDDERFLEAWPRLSLYPQTNKSRHILESLERELNASNEPVDMTQALISQEHMMPQTLSDEWRKELGAEADLVHSIYLHTVGNLTLTGNNVHLGNKPFVEKQEILAHSNFALNAYFADCTAWNKEQIMQRANYLGEIALKIWRRPAG